MTKLKSTSSRFPASALGASALAAVLLAGCVNLAPDYERPAAPVPADWNRLDPAADKTAGTARPADETGWHEFFADARLRQVIELSLANNRDLRVAALNIERARALYQIRNADLYPTVNASGNGTVQRLPDDLSPSGQAGISRQYGVQIGLSSYELDFFGRVRNLRDAALERYLATEEARRSAQISLVAETANAWLTLAADRERLQLARDTLQTRRASHDLTQRSYELGVSSAIDVSQARSQLESARADVARYTAQIAQDNNALALVVGAPVAEELLPEALTSSVSLMSDPPPGVPSEVLQRRPDILGMERELRATHADIGAARAAFFPSITLTAGAGTASASLSGLFKSGSEAWNFIPQINLPIFDMGRREAELDVARTDREIAIAQYEKAIQGAFREVADILADRDTLEERLDARRAQTDATNQTYRLADARYRGGVDSYFSVLDAQRTLYAAQLELIAVRTLKETSTVYLYKALGGGWQ